MLADVLDPYTLRMVLLPVLAAVAISIFVVVRFVSKVALKLVLVAVLLLVGVGVFDQRAQLADCTRTASCTLFGRAVDVPGR